MVAAVTDLSSSSDRAPFLFDCFCGSVLSALAASKRNLWAVRSKGSGSATEPQPEEKDNKDQKQGNALERNHRNIAPSTRSY